MSRDDEAAVFQVVEAILVAVLIASALIFFALVQKPTPSPTSPGLDLARVAGDALDILQGDTPGALATDDLQDEVTDLLPLIADPTTRATEEGHVRTQVSAVLPEGLRFLVRATSDEGVATVYGPSGVVSSPRNAQGAVTYVLDTQSTPDRLVLVELVVWNAF